LNEDIAVISDGGGKAAASMNPVAGKKQVTAMLLGLYKKFYTGSRIEEGEINHHPALFYYEGDQITNCQIFSLDNGLISGVFFVRNPNKLKLLQKTKERCHA
jgi:RNA polymerase sigma-70 factor (ECF subfamily)